MHPPPSQAGALGDNQSLSRASQIRVYNERFLKAILSPTLRLMWAGQEGQWDRKESVMRLSRTSVGFGVAAIVAAGAIAGCGGSGSGGSGGEESTQAQKYHPAAEQVAKSAKAAAPASKSIKLVVKSDEEHGKKGPDGKWHDAYLPADFSVQTGQKVTVTVYNYDEGQHSFTSSSLGVDQTIAGGSATHPSKTTFTFTAPSEAGEYEWFCDFPCDPWAMTHKGFMRGEVTVS